MGNPYETDVFEKLSGGAMRPGGLRITDKVAQKCQFGKEVKILDVGCGTGVTLEYLENKYGIDGIGIDISKVNVEKGKKRNLKLNLLVGNGSRLEFPSQTFDAVLMECSLSVIEQKKEAIHDAYFVLKPGGKLIITDLYLKEYGPVERGQIKYNLYETKHREHGNEKYGQVIKPLPCCINGAFIKEELFSMIEDLGLKITEWEDETEELKDFIVNIIWEYDSMENYCMHITSNEDEANKLSNSMKKTKLGYLLIIAEKPQA